MQDTASTRYLLNRRRRGEPNGADPFAFGFDGTNDYISSNATIGRTGYDMNVSGNVSTGSDGDGNYINFNGNRDATTATGTVASIGPVTTPLFTQATSFSFSVKIKVNSLPANNSTGLFGSSFDATISTDSTGRDLNFILRGSTTTNYLTSAPIFTLGSYFYAHFVYDSTVSKFFCYVDGILQNPGGTSGPTTFSTNDWRLGDIAVGTGNTTSCNKQIYHACIRNKALTQAEVDADIALGNATKQDPSIVAYYVPENLQFNTQYLTNPTALDQSNWIKTGTTSVTANTTVAPDGTTTADTVTIAGTATQGCTTVVTSITGSSIASKTFIVKAFVKVSAGTDQFRLQCSHNGVADYYSGNLTATTDRQEFTFTQTFTSSTSGTGITAGLVNDSGAGGATIQVRNVRLYLTNQTLRDESPNIGGFIGRKTPLTLSAWVKPNIDSANTTTRQVFLQIPRHYLQLRAVQNDTTFRSETTLTARQAPGVSLGVGFRNKVHVLGIKYRDGTGWFYRMYVNGLLITGTQTGYSNTARPATTIYRTNASVGLYTTDYFSGNIRDARIYTFTGSFTDADALAIYNGGEPTSAGITKHLHYKPSVGEVGTTTQDLSPNDRDGTLNGGVTRIYL